MRPRQSPWPASAQRRAYSAGACGQPPGRGRTDQPPGGFRVGRQRQDHRVPPLQRLRQARRVLADPPSPSAEQRLSEPGAPAPASPGRTSACWKETAVRVIIDLCRVDDHVDGVVTIDGGVISEPHPFAGWLELLRLLENLVPP